MRARLKMKNINLLFLCLCLLFTSSFGDGSKQEKDNNSEEIIGEQDSKQTKCQENDEKDCDIDYMNSNETGPLDSHEAMNTREFKARNKRSTEVDKKAFRNMLLGRVHKKSEDMREEAAEIDAEPQKGDASELLLELLVRIATHPQQWNEVHSLLQKIDSDIVTSKKIITDLEKPQESTIGSNTTTAGLDETENITQRTSNTTEDVQKLIILLDNEKQNNFSRSNWPNLDRSGNTNSSEEFEEETYQNLERLSKDQTATTQNMFSWANKPSVKNTTRDFEFAYHRVTGQPLPYRSNYDKARARNAYIAVSVIGPKSRDVPLEKQDNLLEDELRQLKPWNREEENFSNAENAPRKWIFQSRLHRNSNAESP